MVVRFGVLWPERWICREHGLKLRCSLQTDLGTRSCFIDQNDRVKLALFGAGAALCPQDYVPHPIFGKLALRWAVSCNWMHKFLRGLIPSSYSKKGTRDAE